MPADWPVVDVVEVSDVSIQYLYTYEVMWAYYWKGSKVP